MDRLEQLKAELSKREESAAPKKSNRLAVLKAELAKRQNTEMSDFKKHVEQNNIGGYSDKIAQGATFGFADEIYSGLMAPIEATVDYFKGDGFDLGKAYDDNHARQQIVLENANKNTGSLGTAAEIAGGFTTGAELPNLAKSLYSGFAKVAPKTSKIPVLAKLLQSGTANAALTGATMGSVAGAGYAQQGERLSGAVDGAKLGAVTGIGGHAVAKVGAGAVNMFNRSFGTQAKQVARSKVIEALKRDGVDIKNLPQPQNGKPMVLADMAGANTRGLGEASMTIPSAGKNNIKTFLNNRQNAQFGRISKDLQDGLKPIKSSSSQNSQNMNYHKNMDDLLKMRKNQAAPFYDEAYSVTEMMSPKLVKLLENPAIQKAYVKARKLAATEGHKLPKVIKFDTKGNTIIKEYPDMKTWDYIKRGLDDVIEGQTDTFGKIKTDIGRATVGVKNKLLSELDELNPSYAKARAVYSSDTQSLKALEMGRKFLRGDIEMSAKEFNALPVADKDLYRVGIVKELEEVMKKKPHGGNKQATVFNTPKSEEALQMAFSSEAEFQSFARKMHQEAEMFKTSDSQFGSQTQPRQELVKDLKNQDGVLASAIEDGWKGSAKKAAHRVFNGKAEAFPANVTDEIASLIYSRDTNAINRAISQHKNDPKWLEALSKILAVEGGLVAGKAAN